MTITNTKPVKVEDEGERSQSPDILLGAYLMSHLKVHCENCGTLTTPQWRKGWYSDVLHHSVLLCNACGLKYHKNQFCPYCKFVYGKEQKISNQWLICDTCGRWVHKDCEKRFGVEADYSHSYACPECRGPREFEVPNELAAADMREHALETCPKPGYDHMMHESKLEKEDDMEICSTTTTDSEQGRLVTFNIPHIIPSTLTLV